MIKFRMVRINVEQFAILTEEALTADVTVSIALSFKVSPEGKRIACFFDVKFEKDQQAMIILKLNCEFKVQDSDWEKLEKEGEIELPKDIQEVFASQTIGVSRGILFSKTEGTQYNNLILPPINVAKMIRNS